MSVYTYLHVHHAWQSALMTHFGLLWWFAGLGIWNVTHIAYAANYWTIPIIGIECTNYRHPKIPTVYGCFTAQRSRSSFFSSFLLASTVLLRKNTRKPQSSVLDPPPSRDLELREESMHATSYTSPETPSVISKFGRHAAEEEVIFGA